MTRTGALHVTDVPLPYEPRVVDRERQAELTRRYLEPSLAQLMAFFLTVRRQVDAVFEPLQPIKLGKAYPLGQCLEISMLVKREVERPDFSVQGFAPDAAAGFRAFRDFRKAGGVFRQVWGDLRGEFFQNAFQLGTLYLDVSNDTVTPTKPKVEILPFEQARLTPITDYRHFTRLATRYWKHRVYPNHVLPALAPYCPLIHIEPDGTVTLKECTEYMVGLTVAGRFAPSEDVLSDAPMPSPVFDFVVNALGTTTSKFPATPEEGRAMALRACREYREKRWHATNRDAGRINKGIHEANRQLKAACKVQPFLDRDQDNEEAELTAAKRVSIDGTDYLLSDLSEEARRNCDMIGHIDRKLAELQRELEIHRAARKSYVSALINSLPQSKPV